MNEAIKAGTAADTNVHTHPHPHNVDGIAYVECIKSKCVRKCAANELKCMISKPINKTMHEYSTAKYVDFKQKKKNQRRLPLDSSNYFA